jgi:hypothetical protein
LIPKTFKCSTAVALTRPERRGSIRRVRVTLLAQTEIGNTVLLFGRRLAGLADEAFDGTYLKARERR